MVPIGTPVTYRIMTFLATWRLWQIHLIIQSWFLTNSPTINQLNHETPPQMMTWNTPLPLMTVDIPTPKITSYTTPAQQNNNNNTDNHHPSTHTDNSLIYDLSNARILNIGSNTIEHTTQNHIPNFRFLGINTVVHPVTKRNELLLQIQFLQTWSKASCC
jgi:hypothetical protein